MTSNTQEPKHPAAENRAAEADTPEQCPAGECSPPSAPAGGRKPRRPRLTLILCGLLLAAMIGGGTMAYRAVRAPAFGVVEAGVLYRSSQLPPIALRRICRENNIRTIINLRSPGDLVKDPKAVSEQEYAKESGIQFINLPYNTLGADETYTRALQVIQDAANQPVLVHCAGGKERAGVIVAAYRITVQGWSAERALEEMKSYGFDEQKQPRKTEFVRELARQKGT